MQHVVLITCLFFINSISCGENTEFLDETLPVVQAPPEPIDTAIPKSLFTIDWVWWGKVIIPIICVVILFRAHPIHKPNSITKESDLRADPAQYDMKDKVKASETAPLGPSTYMQKEQEHELKEKKTK